MSKSAKRVHLFAHFCQTLFLVTLSPMRSLFLSLWLLPLLAATSRDAEDDTALLVTQTQPSGHYERLLRCAYADAGAVGPKISKPGTFSVNCLR